MNIKFMSMSRRAFAYSYMGIAFMWSGVVQAQALDPEQHMTDDNYQSDFQSKVIDFNATLPWKERFTPSGAFDPRYSVEKGMMAKASMAKETSSKESMSTGAYDAVGIVKGIRTSSGKIKIEHGPIDRLGMPAMTMMFKVSDPEMLQQVKEGATIQFNLDNADGGFTVIKIEQGGN